MKSASTIQLESATIERIEGNIIYAKYTDDYCVEMNDAKEIAEAYAKLANGDSICSLVDLTGIHMSFGEHAQKFLANEAPIVQQKKVIATAIVVDSLPARLIARFFITFHRPMYPTKICKSVEQAKQYLHLKTRIKQNQRLS